MLKFLKFLVLVLLIILVGFFALNIRNGDIYESKPLGFFGNSFNDDSELIISDINMRDINDSIDTAPLESKFDKKIVSWQLDVASVTSFDTDVVGSPVYVLKPVIDENIVPIYISYQGPINEVWTDLREGDSVTVIGEINISEMYDSSYHIVVINEVRPLALKLGEKTYVDGALPKKIKRDVLAAIR